MTTHDDDNDKPRQDWNKLAVQALDLWQNHLTSLSQDEKAKADMANMMKPMTDMATQWAEMMQSSVGGMNEAPQTSEEPERAEEKSKPAPEPTKAENVTKPEEDNPKSQPVFDKQTEMESSPAMPAFELKMDMMPAMDKEQNDLKSDEPANVSKPAEPAKPQPQPMAELVAKSVPAGPASSEPAKSTSGRAASTTGTRDLSDIASRLALLEQELDTLRPRTKRSTENSDDSATGT